MSFLLQAVQIHGLSPSDKMLLGLVVEKCMSGATL